jgi:hypothetical protein
MTKLDKAHNTLPPWLTVAVQYLCSVNNKNKRDFDPSSPVSGASNLVTCIKLNHLHHIKLLASNLITCIEFNLVFASD